MPLCVLLGLIFAVCADASQRTRVVDFDIPALPLRQSLAEFERQAGVELTIPAEIPERLTAPEVKGRLATDVALERLSKPFHIKFAFQEPASFILILETVTPPATPMETITITAAVPEAVGADSRTLNTDQKRTEDDASTYIVYGREAIERSGAMDARSFLTTEFPAYSPRGVALGAAAINGASGQITMRGLSSSETVILFDGHRRAGSYAGGDIQQPDVALIPTAFLSRIDVRTASASALFGSDAVAGAINLVRDRKEPRTHFFFRAEEITGISASSQQFGAERVVRSDRGWFAIDGTFFLDGGVKLGDRNSVTPGRERMARNNLQGYLDSPVPPPGALRNVHAIGEAVFPVGTGARFLFLPPGFRSGDSVELLVGNVNRYDFELPASAQAMGAYSTVRPARRTYSATTAAGWQFTDAWSADIDLGFANSLRDGRVSAFDTLIGQVVFVPGAFPANPLGQDLLMAVSTDVADRRLSREDESRYVTLGASRKFSDATNLRLDHAWSSARAKIREPGLAGDPSGLLSLLLNEDSGADALAGAGLWLTEIEWPEARNTLEETTLRLSSSEVDFLTGPGSSVTISAQRLYGKLADGTHADPFAPDTMPDALQARIAPQREQRILSLVASAKVPIADRRADEAVARLFADVGVRRDSVLISASPDAVEQRALRFSAVSANVALRWQALNRLAYRIQCSTGFLPPPLSSLSDKAPRLLEDLRLVDPERGDEPLARALVISGGNYDLRPEKTLSCGTGLVLTDAQENWRLSVDYNQLKKRRVVLTPLELFFRAPQKYLTEYAYRLRRAEPVAGDPWSVGPITTIETWSVNIARQEVKTVDVLLSGRTHLLGGDVALSMLASAQPVSTHRAAPFSEQEDDAGVGNLASPKFRGTASATWARSGVMLGAATRYSSAYDVSRDEAIYISQGNSGRVASQNYFDVFASYDLSAAKLFGSVRTQLRFDATNVFGRDAPVDLGELGYASRLGVEEFRTLSLTVNVQF